MKNLVPLLSAALLAASPVAAGEVVFGLGRDDITDTQAPSLGAMLEYRTEPVAHGRGADLHFGVAVETDADRDSWIGGGLLSTIPLGGGWRLIPSVMVGVYHPGNGNDLGQDLPMFRTNIEVDVAVAQGWRVGLLLGHKSNLFTGETNPAVESVYLTVNRAF